MEGLFLPDLFSDSKPKWAQTNESYFSEVTEVVRLYLKNVKLDRDPLQAGAFEVNSSNFKVSVDGQFFLVKRWPISSEQINVENQLKLLNYLSAETIPVPSPMVSIGGTFSVVSRSRIWGIFEFVEGEYFHGSLGQIESAGTEIGRLFAALREFSAMSVFPQGPSHEARQEESIPSLVSSRKDWAGILGDHGARLLNNSLDKIWEISQKSRDVKFATPIQLVHYDLHPHNLLMTQKDEPAAFLDFDACARLHPEFGIGFALLKLGRQAASFLGEAEGPSIIASTFLSNLAREYAVWIDPTSLKTAMQIEVLRRIGLILRSSAAGIERSWVHVLPIQVGHLYEIDEFLP